MPAIQRACLLGRAESIVWIQSVRLSRRSSPCFLTIFQAVEKLLSCRWGIMRRFLTVLFLTGAISLSAPAQSSLGLIQPDAGLVFGIEWRKIIDSSIGGLLTDQIKSNLPSAPAGLESLNKMLFDDVDSVLVSSSVSALSKNASMPPV